MSGGRCVFVILRSTCVFVGDVGQCQIVMSVRSTQYEIVVGCGVFSKCSTSILSVYIAFVLVCCFVSCRRPHGNE